MKTGIYSKKQLILLYKTLAEKIGVQPTKKHWNEDASIPSDMPVRMNFGNWTNFVKACGYEPLKSEISIQARLNCIKAHKGHRSMAWKGGRHKDSAGYIQVWMPKHPNSRIAGYVHEHRLIMSNYLKRPLKSHEYIHHKNGKKDDNRLSNLELTTKKVHRGKVICPYCKKEFTIR